MAIYEPFFYLNIEELRYHRRFSSVCIKFHFPRELLVVRQRSKP